MKKSLARLLQEKQDEVELADIIPRETEDYACANKLHTLPNL